MESRRTQGMLIPRSCAISGCEPCQSLTAAALSNLRNVPRGSFGVVTYVRADSVILVGVGAHLLTQEKPPVLVAFVFTYQTIWVSINAIIEPYFIKFVYILPSLSGIPKASFPRLIDLIRKVIFLASTLKVCKPSSSPTACPLSLPCSEFQY